MSFKSLFSKGGLVLLLLQPFMTSSLWEVLNQLISCLQVIQWDKFQLIINCVHFFERVNLLCN